ncbi:MAG: DegT/DnrJ/EryC1/StrS family aminotransferase [Spirochaetales bacterium]
MNDDRSPIPFSRPVLGVEEEEAVVAVLRSGWLTTGKVTAAFEAEFAAYCEVPIALAVNSATAGLHLALEALGVGPGDVCAVPNYTFTATAEVVRYLGAEVALIDCETDSANLDMGALERVLAAQKIKVVLPVHLAGEPVDWPQLKALQAMYGFRIVEDAAHVFPARCDEGYYGALGDIGVYSFYANKNMTTGEGGMIVTRNPEWAARMRVMRLHGIDRDAFERFTSVKATGAAASWEYAVVAPGYKYNLTDIASAIGREQLKKAAGFWRQRQELVKAYNSLLAGVPGLDLPRGRDDHAYHVYSVLLPLGTDRSVVVTKLTEQGIGISVHYIPLHRMPYWKTTYSLQSKDFPNSEARFSRTLSLPLYPALSLAQVERVCLALRQALHGSGGV